MKNTLPRFGITTTFFDPMDVDGFRNAIQDNTRLIYGELIGNPGLDILDLDAIVEIAKEKQIPFMVDATFNTPYLCRCLDYGVNIRFIPSPSGWADTGQLLVVSSLTVATSTGCNRQVSDHHRTLRAIPGNQLLGRVWPERICHAYSCRSDA